MINKKIDTDYTVSIGRNLDEKIKPWIKYLTEKETSDLKILDIGSGGGEFIQELTNLIKDNQEVWSIDSVDQYVTLASNIIGSRAKLGNACEIPFENNFFDAANCSSLLHEVFTYGHNEISGLEALQLSLSEIKRILKEDGLLFYRDVLAPENRAFKQVIYSRESLKFFIKLFIMKFTDTLPEIYKNNYVFRNTNSGYEIFGSSFLHREIQKHYILCIDNISSTIFSLTKKNLKNGASKLEKLTFLEEEFSSLLVSNERILSIAINNWLEREGVEKYTYLSVNELIEFCSADADINGYKLVPVNLPSEYRQLRSQENAFLRQIILEPEEEGKQTIVFKKVTLR